MNKEKEISNGFLIFAGALLLVGMYGMWWALSTINEELSKPVDPYGDCETAEECYHNNPTCKTYAIEGKSCVRDGMTGGFLDSNIYYICEGYGKMRNACQDYYSFEENEKWLDEMRSDVKGRNSTP